MQPRPSQRLGALGDDPPGRYARPLPALDWRATGSLYCGMRQTGQAFVRARTCDVDEPDSARSALESFLDPGFLDLEQVLDAIEHEVVLTESLFGGSALELRKCAAGSRKLAIAISGGGAAGAYSAGLLEVLLYRPEPAVASMSAC